MTGLKSLIKSNPALLLSIFSFNLLSDVADHVPEFKGFVILLARLPILIPAEALIPLPITITLVLLLASTSVSLPINTLFAPVVIKLIVWF